MAKKSHESAGGLDEKAGSGKQRKNSESTATARELVKALFASVISGESRREKAKETKLNQITETALEHMRLGEWQLLFDIISKRTPTPGNFRIHSRPNGGISFQFRSEFVNAGSNTVLVQGYIDLAKQIHILLCKKTFTAESRLIQQLLNDYIKILSEKNDSIERAYTTGGLTYQPSKVRLELRSNGEPAKDKNGLPLLGKLCRADNGEWCAAPTNYETDKDIITLIQKQSVAVGRARSFVAVFENLLQDAGIPHISSAIYARQKFRAFVLDGEMYAVPFLSRNEVMGDGPVQIHISVGDVENGVEQLDFYVDPGTDSIGYKISEIDSKKLRELLEKLRKQFVITNFLPKN